MPRALRLRAPPVQFTDLRLRCVLIYVVTFALLRRVAVTLRVYVYVAVDTYVRYPVVGSLYARLRALVYVPLVPAHVALQLHTTTRALHTHTRGYHVTPHVTVTLRTHHAVTARWLLPRLPVGLVVDAHVYTRWVTFVTRVGHIRLLVAFAR